MAASAHGASVTLYVDDAMRRRYKKNVFAVCFCGTMCHLEAKPKLVDIKNCPSCNRTYEDLETHYDAEIPRKVQEEKDAVAKHSKAKGSVTPSIPFPVASVAGYKHSVFNMFRDLIHTQRCADPSQWDETLVDKHGVAILDNDIEQVMKEYNDDIYNHVSVKKALFWMSLDMQIQMT